MSHAQSLVFLRLFSYALMGTALGVIFPYTLISTARTLRYMQTPSAKTWLRLTMWWLSTLALSYVFGIINTFLGPWSSDVIHVYLQVTAGVFTVTLAIYCWLNRYVLHTLYPKEEFIIEQQKRQDLLNKMVACDSTMPLPRLESRGGCITFANPAATSLVEYSLLQLHKMETGALVHPDDRARVLAHVLDEDFGTYECRIITASGRVVHVEVRSTPDPIDATCRITFLTDVTNYVEQRDRYLREFQMNRSVEQRRVAEQELLAQLGTSHQAVGTGWPG